MHAPTSVSFSRTGRHLRSPLLIALSLIFNQISHAQESETDFLSELPVVLSASRLAQPLAEAPAAVTVIDRETIRSSGARQLADLLRLVPGFQVTNRDQDAARAVYHGLSGSFPQRMQVLIDGRSQYSPLFAAGVNWNLLPVALDDIERIEVIRGSNSAAYGSNAFLGVINISTRHPAETPAFTAEAKSGGDISDQMVRLARRGDQLDLRATYQRSRDNGLDDLADSQRTKLFDLRGDVSLSDQDSLQIGAGSIISGIDQGSGKSTNPLRTPNLESRYLQAHWRRALDNGAELSLRLSHTEDRQKGNSFLVSLGRDSALVDFDGWSRRNEIELQHILNPSSATRLVWGAGWYNELIHQPAQYRNQDSLGRQVVRLFGNLEWRLADDWIANLGGTWEHDSAGATTAAPRLMINHHLAPGHTLRAGASRAYRAASLSEQQGNQYFRTNGGILYEYTFLARGNVTPERINSKELGYLGELPSLNLNIDVRAFIEDIPNRIQTVAYALTPPNCEASTSNDPRQPCGEADYAVNAQKIRTRGAEYQLRWLPVAGTALTFNDTWLTINAELLNFVTSSSAEINARMNDQTRYSAPGRSRSLIVSQALPGNFKLSAALHRVDEMRWTVNSTAPAYNRLDWRLAHNFHAGQTRGEVAFTVQADGSPHAEYRTNEVVTRRGFVTVRLEY